MNKVKKVITDIQSMIEYYYSDDAITNYLDIISYQFSYSEPNIKLILDNIINDNNLIKTGLYNYTDVSCDILLYELIDLSFKTGYYLFDRELFRIDRLEVEIQITDDLTDKQRKVIADLTDTTASGNCFYYYTGDSVVVQLKTDKFIQHLLEAGYVKESV